MKWNKFKDKYPEIGTNIIVKCDTHIAIVNVSIATIKILKACNDQAYYPVECFNSDPDDDQEWDLKCFSEWGYPDVLINSKPPSGN